MSAGMFRGTWKSQETPLQIRFPWGSGAASPNKGPSSGQHLGGTLERVTVELGVQAAVGDDSARADARRDFVRLAGCFRVGSPHSPRAMTSDRVPFRGRSWLVYSFGG